MLTQKIHFPPAVVDCSHVEDLHNLEKDSDLKLVPILRAGIIKPKKFSKMNVLAA